MQVQSVHNEVYQLLVRRWNSDPSFHFTFRRSNREGKLEHGYWFYGNESYLAVSFWTGMDWKNKSPNIIFVIEFLTGETYLEINTSDSDEKRRFINTYLLNELQLEVLGKRFRKKYTGPYLASLDTFIKTDKVSIDEIISHYAPDFFLDDKTGIGFISATEFEEQKSKIDSYRVQQTDTDFNSDAPATIKLQGLNIEDFGPIKHLEITDIPFTSQWIFFTGENGTGKSSILRAIAAAICGIDVKSKGIDNGAPKVELRLFSEGGEVTWIVHPHMGFPQNYPLTYGFAAYGQSRLRTNHLKNQPQLVLPDMNVDDLTASLFDDETYLIDLQHQFERWRSDSSSKALFDKRKYFITEILIDILPNLHRIDFSDQVNDQDGTTYIEQDNDGQELPGVTFDKLASGLKSMVAMIGDILVRLYLQQPEVSDPAEFTGIVLIDEIDIHLHPKLQKNIVIQLTRTFPKIQFIVSTHSPIPLLGAPRNSQLFKVERIRDEGVRITRLDERLHLGDLLPNTILTSPIFGLDDIVPESHENKKLVRTETTYTELEFNDLVKARIAAYLSDEKEQELIRLFRQRGQ
ncbi:AAA family ATPase [Pedobacter sp. MR2016-24]|uniref:AAA family ATPase n=1 Tax=Pedobacter sp. MR2016-24 TaxID=2994466 RepID=UPI00224731B4|nr:AAA family ATPase [Pedobacter sp. MR2016-24]MCX2483699.1 AAA family ATPase [Pedobacter sp. MR2016-24]